MVVLAKVDVFIVKVVVRGVVSVAFDVLGIFVVV